MLDSVTAKSKQLGRGDGGCVLNRVLIGDKCLLFFKLGLQVAVSEDRGGQPQVLGVSAPQLSETISDVVWRRFSLKPGGL